MCNASNHPLGCNCGFGESGGITFRFKSQTSFEFETVRLISFSQILSHTPNASCPVCKEPVFFYKNEYGSGVFFDELGPPWPKHPCTDGAACVPFAINSQYPKESSAKNLGWFAVKLIDASKIKGDCYELQCELKNGTSIQLYLPSADVEKTANLKVWSDESICYLKDEGRGIFSVSLLSDDLRVLNSKARKSACNLK